MKPIGLAIVFVLAAGCRSSPPMPPYSQNPFDVIRAPQFIEQAVMEQHPKFRPSDARVTSEYLEVTKGGVAVTRQIPFQPAARTTSMTDVTRIYFNSIGVMRAIPWRRYYIAELINTDRTASMRIFIRSRERAFQFLDAIHSLRNAQSVDTHTTDNNSKCETKGGTMTNGLCVLQLD